MWMDANGRITKSKWILNPYDGEWYYCKATGEMVTGRCTVEGQTEVFDDYGVWQYSEISEYDTPLGTESWIVLLRSVRFYLNNILAMILPAGGMLH